MQEYNLLRRTYGNPFWNFYNSTLFHRHVWSIHCWTWCIWFSNFYCRSYRDIYSQIVSHTSRQHRHQYLKNIAEMIAISFYNLTKYYLPPFLNKLRHCFTGVSLGARGFFCFFALNSLFYNYRFSRLMSEKIFAIQCTLEHPWHWPSAGLRQVDTKCLFFPQKRTNHFKERNIQDYW